MSGSSTGALAPAGKTSALQSLMVRGAVRSVLTTDLAQLPTDWASRAPPRPSLRRALNLKRNATMVAAEWWLPVASWPCILAASRFDLPIPKSCKGDERTREYQSPANGVHQGAVARSPGHHGPYKNDQQGVDKHDDDPTACEACKNVRGFFSSAAWSGIARSGPILDRLTARNQMQMGNVRVLRNLTPYFCWRICYVPPCRLAFGTQTR